MSTLVVPPVADYTALLTAQNALIYSPMSEPAGPVSTLDLSLINTIENLPINVPWKYTRGVTPTANITGGQTKLYNDPGVVDFCVSVPGDADESDSARVDSGSANTTAANTWAGWSAWMNAAATWVPSADTYCLLLNGGAGKMWIQKHAADPANMLRWVLGTGTSTEDLVLAFDTDDFDWTQPTHFAVRQYKTAAPWLHDLLINGQVVATGIQSSAGAAVADVQGGLYRQDIPSQRAATYLGARNDVGVTPIRWGGQAWFGGANPEMTNQDFADQYTSGTQ